MDLLPVHVEEELGNARYAEGLTAVAGYLGIDSCEFQILVIVGLSDRFENRLDPHAWWACGAPEIYSQSRGIFYQLVQLR